MKSLLPLLLILFVAGSCNNSTESSAAAPENDLDAARSFIRSALDGKYDDARQLMLRDTVNEETLDNIQRNYEIRMSREDKRGYKESTIRFYDTRRPSDSLSIVSYSNTYKNKIDSIKLVKVDNHWLVDLKYSFLPADTSRHAP